MDENRKIAIGLFIVLVLGLFLALFLVRRPTNISQEASERGNLNTSQKINDNNKGPSSSSKNYSTSLKASELGTLTFQISSPSDTPKGNITNPSKGLQKVTSLVIEIEKTDVYFSGNTIFSNKNLWETLFMQNIFSIDLSQITKNLGINISQTKLSNGNYKELRVYLKKATATLPNGKVISLQMPEKNNVIRVEKDFSIDKGKNTNLILFIDPQKSVNFDGTNYIFSPFVSNLLINK